jgi:hypothetical protein
LISNISHAVGTSPQMAYAGDGRIVAAVVERLNP